MLYEGYLLEPRINYKKHTTQNYQSKFEFIRKIFNKFKKKKSTRMNGH